MKKLLALLAFSAALLVAVIAVQGHADACCPEPPANDNFNSATLVNKLPFTDTISTVDASPEGNDPTACITGGNRSVWYRYQPGFDQDVDIDTFGSNFDTILAVYTGTKGNLSQQACNDDAPDHFAAESAVKLNLQGGTTYYILIGGFGGSGGSLTLNVTPQDPVLFDSVALKCYQARIAKRSARFHSETIFTFDPNNGIETETSITGLSLYCNQARVKLIKQHGGAPAGRELTQTDLKVTCYTARDKSVEGQGARTLRGRTVFAQNELFGDQKLQLGRLESVCVLAVKASGQLPNFTPFNGDILRCYSARPVKGSLRPQAIDVGLLDQFNEGGKPVRVLRPVSYCTIGGKSTDRQCIPFDCGSEGGTLSNDPDLIPYESAVVCYSVRQPSTPAITIPVIDQFIDQQFVDPYLSIRKADRLCISSVKKPPYAPNDEIKYATTVTTVQQLSACAATFDICPFEDHVVTMNATRARNDPPMVHCESVADHVDYGHSVWYTFTPQNSIETDINFSTADSSYDTVLAVYTGSKGSLTQVACNDDIDQYDTASLVEFNAVVGQKYYIMVGSKDRTPGGKLKFHAFDACNVSGPCD